ncbi:MAG: CHAD domain-containing protein, partial [Gemmataceae bacterium]|nr:CHAD domain-containing protein [Gemmataceae bacterium]
MSAMTAARVEKWVPGVSPQTRTSAAAVAALRTRLEAVQHYLPLAAGKADEDPEYVHELRVWTRRAAEALDVFADLLPHRRAAWLSKQLKRLRRAANEARDLDVLAQRLEAKDRGPGAARLLEQLRERRAEAQRPLVALNRRLRHHGRLARRAARLVERVRPRRRRDGPFGAWAREHLRPVVDAFFAAAPADLPPGRPAGTDLAALHRFRVAGKNLRYAMELLAGALPVSCRERLYPAVEALQERLGEVNDRATARLRLRERLAQAEDEQEAGHVRDLLTENEARLGEALQAFRDCFTPARREELRAGFDVILAEATPCPGRHSGNGRTESAWEVGGAEV